MCDRSRFVPLLAVSIFALFSSSSAAAQIPVPLVNSSGSRWDDHQGTPDRRAEASAGPANLRQPDGEVELVVALFRHGVRAPVKDFGEHAKDHSCKDWPDLENDWGVCAQCWGDLTPHGRFLVRAIGKYYASEYGAVFGKTNLKVFLWADVDNRTRDTADAIARGFGDSGVTEVEVAFNLSSDVDLLFHPFRALCGTPDPDQLKPIADDINSNAGAWFTSHISQFNQLGNVLDCRPGVSACQRTPKCTPLFEVTDSASYCRTPNKSCSSPINWKGRFSYASSVSAAFLLEYGNRMAKEQVGWGRVVPPSTGPSSLKDMLQFHEFYFDQTERRPYLARIQGSNLIKEILDLLDRKAGWVIDGCPHAQKESNFVGLVGHDTNLASVGSLLKVSWAFDDPRLPDDSRNLPTSDALPAGALVFELRLRGGARFVRIEYVTYSLQQMRSDSDPGKAFQLGVQGPACQGHGGPCEIPLGTSN